MRPGTFYGSTLAHIFRVSSFFIYFTISLFPCIDLLPTPHLANVLWPWLATCSACSVSTTEQSAIYGCIVAFKHWSYKLSGGATKYQITYRLVVVWKGGIVPPPTSLHKMSFFLQLKHHSYAAIWALLCCFPALPTRAEGLKLTRP